MPNQFSIQPASGTGAVREVMRGMRSMIDSQVEVAQKNKQKKEKEDFANLVLAGDPEAVRKAAMLRPDLAKEVQGGDEARQDIIKQRRAEMAINGLMGNMSKTEAAIDYTEKAQADGQDTTEGLALARTAGESEVDPEKAKKTTKAFEMALALNGTKEQWDQYKEFSGVAESVDQYEGLTAGYEEYLRVNQISNSKESFAAYKKMQVDNKKLMTNAAKDRPYVSKLMADGWLPSGRITGPQLDAFEAAAGKAIEQGKPLTVQDLRDMEFRAQKNKSTGAAAGSRLVIARKQNIEAAFSLVDDMQKTSAKLNYSPVKFIGALEKWKKGQTGDTLFTEYMTQRSDSLFILGNALKQNGLTDKSIEVEEEAFSPTLAPKQFNAWLNVQKRALNRAAHEINQDYKYGIEQVPVYPAGQSGAPTPENPTPTLPGEQQSPKYQEGQQARLQDGSIVVFRNGNWEAQ